MQTTFTASRTPAAFKAGKPAASARRSAVVVRAARDMDFVQTLGKHAAVAAAALALTLAPPAEAKLVTPKPSAFEKEQAYQAELLASIKARTGKDEVLPDLKASPTDAVKVESKAATLKFDGGFEKVAIETPAATPAPAPAVPAAVAPPKAAPAPAPAAASYKAAAPAATSSAAPDSGDNKGLLIGGLVGVLALAGVAAAGNNGEGEAAVAGGAPVAAAGGSDVPPNVAEARAWIAAWKQKHGKA